MFELLNDLKGYNPTRLDKIKPEEETLNDAEKLYKNRSNVITHLKIEFFRLTMDFKKKSQICLTKHYQIV